MAALLQDAQVANLQFLGGPMRCMIRIALALAMLSCVPHLLADPVNVVPYVSLTGTGLITFDDIAGGPAPGTNYDGILTSGGASFAERFLGQTLSFNEIGRA